MFRKKVELEVALEIGGDRGADRDLPRGDRELGAEARGRSRSATSSAEERPRSLSLASLPPLRLGKVARALRRHPECTLIDSAEQRRVCATIAAKLGESLEGLEVEPLAPARASTAGSQPLP